MTGVIYGNRVYRENQNPRGKMSDENGSIPSLDDIVLTPEEKALLTPEFVEESIRKAMLAIGKVEEALERVHEPYREGAKIFVASGKFPSQEFTDHLNGCDVCQEAVEKLINLIFRQVDR